MQIFYTSFTDLEGTDTETDRDGIENPSTDRDKDLLIGTGFETVFFGITFLFATGDDFSVFIAINPSSERRLANARFDTGFFTRIGVSGSGQIDAFFAPTGQGLISFAV